MSSARLVRATTVTDEWALPGDNAGTPSTTGSPGASGRRRARSALDATRTRGRPIDRPANGAPRPCAIRGVDSASTPFPRTHVIITARTIEVVAFQVQLFAVFRAMLPDGVWRPTDAGPIPVVGWIAGFLHGRMSAHSHSQHLEETARHLARGCVCATVQGERRVKCRRFDVELAHGASVRESVLLELEQAARAHTTRQWTVRLAPEMLCPRPAAVLAGHDCTPAAMQACAI